MKTGRGKTIAGILLAVILAVLLIPMPFGIDDGGSHGWQALLWNATYWHNCASREGEDGFETGTTVRALGFTVYDDHPREFIPNGRRASVPTPAPDDAEGLFR